jgi:hypothetical protein
MPPNSKILLKKGKKYLQEEGGLSQNPQKKNTQKTENAETDYIRQPVVRQTNYVTKEIHMP